jgi:uncharacterized protein with gpF-like domain
MSILSKLLGEWGRAHKPGVEEDFRGSRLTPSTIRPDERLNFGKRTITLPDFVSLSLDSIDGLAAEHRATVTQIILEGSKRRSPAREVAKRLQQQHPVDRQTAIAIVSLQLSRIAAFLDRERSLEAGITRFKWRWSGSLDENPAHQAREGLVLSWSNPTIDGKSLDIFDLPGMASDCHCRAQSVLDFD